MTVYSRFRQFLFRRAKRHAASPRRRLQLQPLEDRLLLSGLTLLGQWNGAAPRFADGWVEGNYAYVSHYGVNGGAHILDISDPKNPYETATFFSPSGWNDFRDLQVHNGILYVSSDSGGGLIIADVSDPYNPFEITRITGADGGFSTVHTFDVDGPYLYEADGRTRTMHVFDVSDPYNPRKVRSFNSTLGAGIHEVTVKDGRLYTAGMWVVSSAEIFDVSDIENGVELLGIARIGSLMAHTTWPTDDHQFMAVAAESERGDVSFWDISDPSNPQLAWRLEQPATEAWCAHQVWIQGDLLFASWYQAGIFVYDIADRYNPVLLGSYDTFDGEIFRPFPYQGAWGVMPFTLNDDGYQYVAGFDLQSGVFLFRLDLDGPSPGTGTNTPIVHRFSGSDSRSVRGAGGVGRDVSSFAAEDVARVRHGVLDIILGAGSDTVTVGRNVAAGTIEVTVNGVRSFSFGAGEVRSVNIRGLEGDDEFILDPDLNLPTSIDGGPGTDRLTGWPQLASSFDNPEAQGIHRLKGGDYVRQGVEIVEESGTTLGQSVAHPAMSLMSMGMIHASSVDAIMGGHAGDPAMAAGLSGRGMLASSADHGGSVDFGDLSHWRGKPFVVKWHEPG